MALLCRERERPARVVPLADALGSETRSCALNQRQPHTGAAYAVVGAPTAAGGQQGRPATVVAGRQAQQPALKRKTARNRPAAICRMIMATSPSQCSTN